MPTLRLHSSWLDAHAEWGPGLHEDGFGLSPSDDVVSYAGFSAWGSRLISASDPRTADYPTASHCIYRWMVEATKCSGALHSATATATSSDGLEMSATASGRRQDVAGSRLGRLARC